MSSNTALGIVQFPTLLQFVRKRITCWQKMKNKFGGNLSKMTINPLTLKMTRSHLFPMKKRRQRDQRNNVSLKYQMFQCKGFFIHRIEGDKLLRSRKAEKRHSQEIKWNHLKWRWLKWWIQRNNPIWVWFPNFTTLEWCQRWSNKIQKKWKRKTLNNVQRRKWKQVFKNKKRTTLWKKECSS